MARMHRPALTWLLLTLTILVHAMGTPPALWLWPLASEEFRPYQLVTYAFTHGNWLHLFVNVLALMSFGPALERTWGRGKFLVCYTVCAVGAGLIQASMGEVPLVGASGALFGLFAAYVFQHPHRPILSLLLWPLPAWLVLALYVLLSALAWAFEWLTGFAHLAHIGGAATGLLFALAYNDKRPG